MAFWGELAEFDEQAGGIGPIGRACLDDRMGERGLTGRGVWVDRTECLVLIEPGSVWWIVRESVGWIGLGAVWLILGVQAAILLNFQ